MNFSGYDFPTYRLGVENGVYKIVLCTDDKRFGGLGRIKRKTLKSVKKQAHGFENSVSLTLPSFSAMYLVEKS